MTSSDSSSDEAQYIANKYRKQRFCAKWLKDEKLSGWLEQVEDDNFKCRCIACGKYLNCGKSDLYKHSETKTHQRNVLKIKNIKTVNSFFDKKKNSEVDAVKMFEIKLSLFFAEHNVAIQIIDHLIPLLKDIAPDSSIIQNCQLGRTKCSQIINNVLAKEEKDKLISKLKITKFSVLVDESTDVACKKTMCVLVRYFDDVDEKTVVKLLDLIPVGVDCSAEAIYGLFKECILGYNIPYENIIGLCCDGAHVMVGRNNSFTSRLLKDNPNVITVKCICHSAAIIANKACLKLARAPEDLIRQIGTYVSGSPKRCAQLEEFQVLMSEEKRKILRTSSTRWLSHQKCIERILENWQILIEYFTFVSEQDKLKTAEHILNELKNDHNKAYLLFLKYVLNYFNNLNALFQSKKTLVHVLHSESKKIFLKLGQNFIKKEYLKTDCNLKSSDIFLSIEDVYVGNECEDFLNGFSESTIYEIKWDCLQFYITALEETQSRLPLQDSSIFKEMEFINPELAIKGENKNLFKFNLICQKYNINVNLLIQEWLTMEFNFSEAQKQDLCKLDIEEFWSKISKCKDFNNKLLFPNFSKLIKIVLSLPHANADAERIFSIVTDVRTKKRNKLSNEILNSICIIRSHLQSNSLNCISFTCSASHLKRHNYKDLYN